MYKLLHPFSSFFLLLFSGIIVQAQTASKFNQLLFVNQEWNKQTDVDPAFNQQASVQLNEQQLIQLHLQETEKLLRSRTMQNLSPAQKENRLKNLDVLHQYWKAGSFPINTMHSNRQPYFIDEYNTYCAVGYLMKMSGANEMAQAIHAMQNFNYLADINHPDLMKWVENSGLTLDELALIQPGYGGEWPAAIIEMHYNNVGQDVGEYIELHQSNGGLIGMSPVNTVNFYNHLGTLYKTLPVSQMQAIGTNYGYYYQFPSSESFADSGRVELLTGSQVRAVLRYNAAGTVLEDYYYLINGNPTIRQFSGKEDNNTPIGSSLTFCGVYTSTWNPSVLPVTTGTVNPCTVGALPINLLSFNYLVQNKSVQLNWQTATELNNDHFELERSTDGIHFTTIHAIKGTGTSTNIHDYSYTDNTPNYLNHYRLKQVDKDGKFSYSQILFVKFLSANPLAVIQNPVKQTLRIQLNSTQAETGTITIYDMMGRVMLQSVAKQGSQFMNVAALGAGKYLIRFMTKDGQVYNQQFIKQ